MTTSFRIINEGPHLIGLSIMEKDGVVHTAEIKPQMVSSTILLYAGRSVDVYEVQPKQESKQA